jgi:hypothetical protein
MSKKEIKVTHHRKFETGCESTVGIRIEIEEIDDGGERQRYMIWLSVNEARDLTQRLYDTLSTPKTKLPPEFQ